MADVVEFFRHLPGKLGRHPDVAQAIRAVFRFEIEGAGTWTVDLREGAGEVHAGGDIEAGCVVAATRADFEALMANPAVAMVLFAQGRLRVSNPMLALSLKKLF